MFLSRNKKNNVYLYKSKFYYIKVGFKGSKLHRHVFVMDFICGVCFVNVSFVWCLGKAILHYCGIDVLFAPKGTCLTSL